MCINRTKEQISRYELNRAEKENMLDLLEIKHQAFMNALDNFKGKGDQDITKSTLKAYPFMKWVVLNESPLVKFRRRGDISENTLMFDCYMEKGGEFGMHLHSDCVEECEVVQGELFDVQFNQTFKEGDIALYEKGVKHIPIATQETLLRVFFT